MTSVCAATPFCFRPQRISRRGVPLRATTLSRESATLFPFDGECEGSAGADLTVKFEDESTLKAHSQHLQQASAILRSAIRDCSIYETLHVGDDNREAWVLLLNLVHPGRRMGNPEGNADSLNIQTMEVYAALAQKYGVVCMHDFVDNSLCRTIDKEKARLPANIVKMRSIDRLGYSSSRREEAYIVPCFSEDSFLYKCSRLVAKFGLDSAKEANALYFEEIVERLNKAADDEMFQRKEMGPLIASFVEFLSRHEEYQYACVLMQRGLRLLRS